MLTLFACPKSFSNAHISLIQRNAIQSWILLKQRPEIILIGDEPGVAEICKEFALKHVPGIARNEFGTPLVNDVFARAQQAATHELMGYVNADIILTSDLSKSIDRSRRIGRQFLMSGGRWDYELKEPLRFSGDWESSLLSSVFRSGKFSFWGNDLFVFSRGMYREMPPLALGRGWFDGWLFWRARSMGVPVIDASEALPIIHQNHDYVHAGVADATSLWKTKEAQRNLELARLPRHWFLMEATHVLTTRGLKRVWGRKLRHQLREFVVYRMGALRHALGLRRNSSKSLARANPSGSR